MKRFFKEQLFPVIMIIIGAGCAAFSIECFLIPNTILDGGVTGVSMMINYLSGISLSILVVIINIPFFFVGYKALGRRFLLRAVIAMASFSAFLELCKLIPSVTRLGASGRRVRRSSAWYRCRHGAASRRLP